MTRGLGAQEFALAPSADEGDGELVNWAGFDAFEPPPEAAEPDAEGARARQVAAWTPMRTEAAHGCAYSRALTLARRTPEIALRLAAHAPQALLPACRAGLPQNPARGCARRQALLPALTGVLQTLRAAPRAGEPFCQRAELRGLSIMVDYWPRRLDLAALKAGNLAEVLNLAPWGGVLLQLPPARLSGVHGWPALGAAVGEHWLRDVVGTQARPPPSASVWRRPAPPRVALHTHVVTDGATWYIQFMVGLKY